MIANNQIITVPVSVGELYDKYSILQIKQVQIKDEKKLESVNKEIAYLEEYINKLQLDKQLEQDMKTVNEQLWIIEDKIREKEHRSEFDEEFILLARSVYKINDERSNIKNKINTFFNSEIKDIKSYVQY